MKKKSLGIYIHIPFCERKCPYCDFYSIEDKTLLDRYVSALAAHIKEYGGVCGGYSVDSIYFGGGTPSLLGKKHWKVLFSAIEKNFSPSKSAEFTVEVNPASADLRLLRYLRKNGVNRLSIGAQSFNDAELAAIGRLHSSADIMSTIEDAKKAKIKNLTLDLIYGLPSQTLESFKDSLNKALSSGISHLSCYGLKIEEGTPFGDNPPQDIADEDLWVDMYEELCSACKEQGFNRYEISNFAKEKCESRHNLKYWKLSEYLGLGTSAHSYLGGKRFSFIKDVESYCKAFEGDHGINIIDEEYEAPLKHSMADFIMLSLRLEKGLDTRVFRTIYRRDFEEIFKEKLQRYMGAGLMVKDGEFLRFTTRGFCVSNNILAELIYVDE